MAGWKMTLQGDKPPPIGRILAGLVAFLVMSEVAVVAGGLYILRMAVHAGVTPDQIGVFLGVILKKALGL